MRCNKCLRKITDENLSSSLDRFGKPLCDHCGTCGHLVALNKPCRQCDALYGHLLLTVGP